LDNPEKLATGYGGRR